MKKKIKNKRLDARNIASPPGKKKTAKDKKEEAKIGHIIRP